VLTQVVLEKKAVKRVYVCVCVCVCVCTDGLTVMCTYLGKVNVVFLLQYLYASLISYSHSVQ